MEPELPEMPEPDVIIDTHPFGCDDSAFSGPRRSEGGMMGVHVHGGTMPGAVTPICNHCGISLCWDIAESQYEDEKAFWDAWICRDCNGGEPVRRPKEKSPEPKPGA